MKKEVNDTDAELQAAIDKMLEAPDEGLTVDIEVEDDESDDVVVTETEEEVELEKPEPEVTPEPEVKQVTTEVKPEPRKSRAQDRIRELANERRKLLEENESLKVQKAETEKAFAARMVEALETQIEIAKRAKLSAIESQDAETQIKLDDELAELKSQLSSFKGIAATTKEPVKQTHVADNTIPTEAQLWAQGKEFMIDNSTYASLPRETRAKIAPMRDHLRTVAQFLIQDGWDVNSPKFYEEVDIRMGIQFPDYDLLASQGIDALEYTEEQDKKSVASAETKKPDRNKTTSEKAKSIPVTAVKTAGTGKQKTTVPMSKEEYRFWEKHLQPNGISLKEYAQEIKRFEAKRK